MYAHACTNNGYSLMNTVLQISLHDMKLKHTVNLLFDKLCWFMISSTCSRGL